MPAHVVEGRVDRLREVESQHLAALGGGDLREAARPHPGVEDQAAPIVALGPAGHPLERPLRFAQAAPGVELHAAEAVPLEAEARGIRAVVHEPGHATPDGVAPAAARGEQATLDHLGSLRAGRAQLERVAAGGTNEKT